MACYTISECVLLSIGEDGQDDIITDLLNVVLQKGNSHQIAIDKCGTIKNKYTEIAQTYEFRIKVAIINWLEWMAKRDRKWEYVDIEDASDNIFLEVCCKTADKKLIVYSENKWNNGKSTDRPYSHKGILITILNKDEAILELQPKTINAINSIVVTDGIAINPTLKS